MMGTSIPWNLCLAFLCLVQLLPLKVNGHGTCTLILEDESSITLNRGESVHQYRPNRCQDNASHPCYCNPDAPNQIDCPYCWLPAASGDLICARDGQSVTFTDLQSNPVTCECSVSDSEFNEFSTNCNPADSTPTLEESSGVAVEGISGVSPGGTTDDECCYFGLEYYGEQLCIRVGQVVSFVDSDGQDQTCGCEMPEDGSSNNPRPLCLLADSAINTCFFDLEEGGFAIIAAGDSLEPHKTSRCGESYPCYCDPSLRGQIYCPYCVYPENSDSLVCAQNGQTVTYVNMTSQLQETCSCEISFDRNVPPISTCFPTTPVNIDPVAGENDPIIDRPGLGDRPLDDPEDPGFSFGEDQERPISDDPTRFCEIGGNIFREGENVGDALVTRCGSTDDYPCFCNPDNSPPIECPYCGFALRGKRLLCLKNDQVANFIDIDDNEQTCACSAPMGADPAKNCLMTRTSINSCVFELQDGTVHTFDNGEPVGDVLPGECGSNFPCYCDPAAENQLSCPYCQARNSRGEVVCAAHQDTISFEDENGQDQRCSCEIPSDSSTSIEPVLTCNLPRTEQPITKPSQAPAQLRVTSSCSVRAPTGETVTVSDGASFGKAVEGVCGAASDWPSFCNADETSSVARQTSQEIEYPYCVFQNTLTGGPVCARNSEQVSFVDVTGATVQCSCIYVTRPVLECAPAANARQSNSRGMLVAPLSATISAVAFATLCLL